MRSSTKKSIRDRCLRWSLAWAAWMAVEPVPAIAQEAPVIIQRSGREARTVSRLGQPGQERRTHRGWEVYGDDFVVVANSSRDDAQLVAAHFAEAIQKVQRTLESVTGPLPKTNRGRSAVQIMIDRDPSTSFEPPPTIRRSGFAQSVYFNVSAEQPSLAQQLPQQTAAAAVYLVDSRLSSPSIPDWVRQGLVAYVDAQVASQSGTAGSAAAGATVSDAVRGASHGSTGLALYRELQADSVARGKHPWDVREEDGRSANRYATRKALAGLAPSNAATVANDQGDDDRVRFLLTAYDGRFAAMFGDTLRQVVLEAGAEQGPQRKLARQVPGAPASSPFDEIVASLEPQLQAWRKDPTVGTPKWEPLDDQDPALTKQQQELLVALRLLERERSSGPPRVEPRVIELSGPGDSTVASKPLNVRPLDLGQWVQTASQSARRWAIVDVNDTLLWSTDADRLGERLGLAAGQTSAAVVDGRVVVRRVIDDHRTLEGWLEPAGPGRPGTRAKFTIRGES